MNVKLFQELSEILLKKHYGIDLSDTRLSEETYVAGLVEDGVRPVAYLSEFAEDTGLDRVDTDWMALKHGLTERDELNALAELKGTTLLDDQPATCGLCGSRTDFEEYGNGLQRHCCLNHECLNEFLAEDDPDPDSSANES